jgi:hypothetical protein
LDLYDATPQTSRHLHALLRYKSHPDGTPCPAGRNITTTIDNANVTAITLSRGGYVANAHNFNAAVKPCRYLVHGNANGAHNAASLRQIYAEGAAALEELDAAIKTLEGIPEGEPDTVRVLGSRGLYGTERYPGAIPKLEQFCADAKKKAFLLVNEIRRKRHG